MKTLRQLERINKSFLWGDKECMQGIHLVSSETICKPKGEGGLGLHSLTHTNQVLLAKTAWRLAKLPEAPLGSGDHPEVWPPADDA